MIRRFSILILITLINVSPLWAWWCWPWQTQCRIDNDQVAEYIDIAGGFSDARVLCNTYCSQNPNDCTDFGQNNGLYPGSLHAAQTCLVPPIVAHYRQVEGTHYSNFCNLTPAPSGCRPATLTSDGARNACADICSRITNNTTHSKANVMISPRPHVLFKPNDQKAQPPRFVPRRNSPQAQPHGNHLQNNTPHSVNGSPFHMPATPHKEPKYLKPNPPRTPSVHMMPKPVPAKPSASFHSPQRMEIPVKKQTPPLMIPQGKIQPPHHTNPKGKM